MPVPVSPIVCGLPLALSVTVKVAERAPVTLGENVILILTLLPEVTMIGVAGALTAKSAAFGPEIAKLDIVRFPAPVSVNVTGIGLLVVATVWLLKLTLPGLIPIDGTTPAPDIVSKCGLPVALSTNCKVADRAPVAEGVNVTLIVALPPGATVIGSGLALYAKSPGKAPMMVMLEIMRLLVPELPTTTGVAVLGVFRLWLPKFKLAGVSVMTGAPVPVPVNDTICGLPVALSVTVSVAVRRPTPAGLKLTPIDVRPLGPTVSGSGADV